MVTASAQPQVRTAAHRRVVMQHIGATLVPTAISFALLAPFVGLVLIGGSTFIALFCNAISTAGATLPVFLETGWNAFVAAYLASAIAATISGVWVAMLSPFSMDNSRFWSGAAIIGMMNGFLFVSVAPDAGIFGGQLFLAVVGAVSVFLCAWLLKDAVLKRDDMRRDTLSRDRADRLAKERAKA